VDPRARSSNSRPNPRACGGVTAGPRLLGPHSLEAEAELTSNRECEVYFIWGESVAPSVIHHKFADQCAVCRERDKGKRPDTFFFQRRLERWRQVRNSNVVDQDRFGIFSVGRPRRVTFDRPPIALRQSAPGNKPNHARAVEEQDCCALTMQSAPDGSQRSAVNVLY
jgi:hypothetical protein